MYADERQSQQLEERKVKMSENELIPDQDEAIEVADDELEEVNGGKNQIPRRRKRIICYSCRQYGYIRRGDTTCPHCGAELKPDQLW